MPVFSLEIITPDKVFFSGEVEMVVLKTPEGEMGVLKDHMPIVAVESAGSIRLLKDGNWLEAILSDGFVEINLEKTIILTHDAQWN